MSSPYQNYIWNYLLQDIGNEMGVAALMGNLEAESGLIPYRKQGDFTSGYTKSIAYTSAVNNKTYTKEQFISDSIGYGLAQWTFSSRKEKLYNAYQTGHYSSIGSTDLACSYLLSELKSDFPAVYQALRNASSIRQASDIVLIQFESPKDISEPVKQYRESLGIAIYNEEHGKPPGPIPPEPPSPSGSIPIWMMFKLAK